MASKRGSTTKASTSSSSVTPKNLIQFYRDMLLIRRF